jgi:hypothetical protein
MEENENVINLTEDEAKLIKTNLQAINANGNTLGQLRHQYIEMEGRVVEDLKKTKEELNTYVKMLARNKNINFEDGWQLDPVNMCFRKTGQTPQ